MLKTHGRRGRHPPPPQQFPVSAARQARAQRPIREEHEPEPPKDPVAGARRE